MNEDEITKFATAVAGEDRRALARAVTLVESTNPDHRAEASKLLSRLRKLKRNAVRIGLSGTPGVGKSTFIESFGMMLTERGKRVAVLAVDPSSVRTGGAILGDKTRMPRLSREKAAFIRPSPSKATLGGVATQTRSVIELMEGAGFDVIIIETVGVGQSETMVADMTDLFVLLLAPAGGDELQGVKRGIMERADLILVNKADGALRAQAIRTAADYAGALRLLRQSELSPPEYPLAITVSALDSVGIDDAWRHMETLLDWRRRSGVWDMTRERQALAGLSSEIDLELQRRLAQDPLLAALRADVETLVSSGELSPQDGAIRVVDAMMPDTRDKTVGK